VRRIDRGTGDTRQCALPNERQGDHWGSPNEIFSTTGRSLFFEPFQIHVQPPAGYNRSALAEASTILELCWASNKTGLSSCSSVFHGPTWVGYFLLLCNLVHRLDLSDHLKCNLGLGIPTEMFVRPPTHHLLLFFSRLPAEMTVQKLGSTIPRALHRDDSAG
jgi:hypothetical protein